MNEELKNEIKKFDRYYMYSDDGSVYSKGAAKEKELIERISEELKVDAGTAKEYLYGARE